MKIDEMYPFAEELRAAFRVRHGSMDTEHEMARELIALNLKVMQLHERVRDLERDRLRSYHREPSIHYMRTHSQPIDDNNWFAPEKDDGHA
jgi:hypothetical protein